MLHDIAIITVFLAMLIAPCVITLRSQRDPEDQANSSAEPLPRTR
jgi:hypothetical protein